MHTTKESMLYEKLPEGKVCCNLCAHCCVITNGKICHKCRQMLVQRLGYRILENRVQPNGRCPNCGMPVAGVGMG